MFPSGFIYWTKQSDKEIFIAPLIDKMRKRSNNNNNKETFKKKTFKLIQNNHPVSGYVFELDNIRK